jgi:CRISPR-associated protein Csd1
MLINALCRYYDVLASSGKVLPDGYSEVKISYLIELNEDGSIDNIIDYRKQTEEIQKNGKIKEIMSPRKEVMPKRTEKTAIESNIIEHRPLYIFGLRYNTERKKKLESPMRLFDRKTESLLQV